ncbi:MAG: hypothetical protein HYS87_01700 [Candidatus Colwellbacteria bacterium]|nr:hypothetical protein [Candidatus Colwellbacteria bacterium]
MNVVIGLFFILILSVIFAFVLWKFGIRDKRVYIFFAFTLLIHISAVLFIDLTDFQPFSGGGGDYNSYHKAAESISRDIRQWNAFPERDELGGVSHYYPVIIGYVYFLTVPSMVVGQLFNAWIASIAVILLYFIVLEVTQSPKWAFSIGLGANFYPSFLFYSSLLLKDVFVIVFALASVLLILHLLKRFSWRLFALFYVSIILLTHFRFYEGFIMLVAFVVSWFLLSREPIKARFTNGVVLLVLLGFIPQMFGMGYYGLATLQHYANPVIVDYYQDIAYTGKDVAPAPVTQEPVSQDQITQEPVIQTGFASTTDVKVDFSSPKAFLTSFPKALTFVSIGPFPWQFKEARHYFALLETIPWTALSVLILLGIVYAIKQRHPVLSITFFSLGLFLMLMIYISNFGITMRIRIPVFLLLSAFIPFGVVELNYLKSRFVVFIKKKNAIS